MKFSIRDLLLVTVIVAVLVAWWVEHRQQARRIEELDSMLEQAFPPVIRGTGRRYPQAIGDY